MLSAFVNAFRTPDLRRKLLFVLMIIVIFRAGSQIPAPGVDVANVQSCIDGISGENAGIYNLINLFSGGALLQLTIFALGIMPYITASIILQLLVVVIPRLEALKKEGQSGQTKITQYTRYLTLGPGRAAGHRHRRAGAVGEPAPGLRQAPAGRRQHPDLPDHGRHDDRRHRGDHVARRADHRARRRQRHVDPDLLPGDRHVPERDVGGRHSSKGWWTFGVVLAIGLVIVAAVIFIEQAQRRIPVQYARRMVGRKMFGGSSTYIPLKVNQAGIIPVIFASSLLYLPAMMVQFNQNSDAKWVEWVSNYFVTGDHPLYMATYFGLIVFFTYFYVSITFNPQEVADNMKKYGGFIPGIRAGKPTEDYLSYVLSRITAPGALYLGLIALIPLIALVLIDANQNFPFGGTSILIMVGVALDTVKQIESQLQQRNYEGFLR